MLLTRSDKWLIAILFVAAAAGIALNLYTIASVGGQSEAQVYKDGQLVQTIRLRAGYSEQLRVGGLEHYNVVVAANGLVHMEEADCPDQVCVRAGWVGRAPQQIVCLPHRVVIKIVTAAPSDIDDITR